MMSGNSGIDDLSRRARTAGYADGLLEIFAATVLLVIALGWAANPGFVGILAAFIVLYGWKAVDRVKQRITYPRIGYSRERPDDDDNTARGMLLFLGGAFAATALLVWIGGGLTEAAQWRRAAPVLSGISLAGGFWYAARSSGLIRFRLIAVLSLFGGLALWIWGSGDSYSGVIWHLVGLAIPLAALGAWSLRRFVSTHPVRVDDDG